MKKVNSESNVKTNIITSDDIIVVDNTSIGKDLTEVISEHEERLNRLSSNDKWLYKYGGFGSGGGPSEGGSTRKWQIKAQINATTISNNTITFDDSVKKYILHVEVLTPITGQTYRLTIASSNNSFKVDRLYLNESNEYTYEVTLTTLTNCNINISVINNERETKDVSCTIVTTPYTFNSSFVDSRNNQITTNDDDIFLSFTENGLKIKIDYNIAVILSDVTKLKINANNLGITAPDKTNNVIESDDDDYPYMLTNASGAVYITIPNELLTEANAGYYTLSVKFLIHPLNQNDKTYEMNIGFNLIPSSLYLKVKSQLEKYNIYNRPNSNYELYTEKQNELTEAQNNYDIAINDDDKARYGADIERLKNELNDILQTISIFPIGAISLILQGYYGARSNKSFRIEVSIKGPNDTEFNVYDPEKFGYTSIEERTMYIVNIIPGNEAGEYAIKFTLKYQGDEASFIHYAYLDEIDNDLLWYNKVPFRDGNYYRGGLSNGILSSLNTATIDMKSNYENKTLFDISSNTSNIIPETTYDILISIGIQYSIINDTSKPILSLVSKGGAESKLTIYQDKISIGGSYNTSIFLPKEDNFSAKKSENYHLLTIYERYISENKYEINVYLDGTLEGSITSFVDINGYISAELLPGNYSINNFELTYFVISSNNGNITNQLSDVDISQYYYKYCEKFKGNINTNFVDLLKYLQYFEEDENGMIKVTNSASVASIANEINVPVLVLDYNENDNIDANSDGSRGIDFVNWFVTGYGQEVTDFPTLKISKLRYSNGVNSLMPYDIPTNVEGFSNSYFYIEIQGSSTKNRKAKNLNIGIHSGETNYTVLFTPNFKNVDDSMTTDEKKECYNTFLPEAKFTLKADVVDSTHSNNTSIGAFVNENTTKFNTGVEGKYKNYVKNCLLGFVTLVFINVTYKENSTTDCYYLGIYNFNLGRDSYMNMGYVNDLSDLDKYDIKDGFGFYAVKNAEYITSENLIVAEIQNNSPYFDFSQCDKSVLFPSTDLDTGAMFGDFVPDYGDKSDKQAFVQNNIYKFVESIALSGGFIFNTLGKHMSNNPSNNYGYDSGYHGYIGDDITKSSNSVPNYKYQFVRDKDVFTYVDDGRHNLSNGTLNDLQSLIVGYADLNTNIIHKPSLDYRSCVEYYTTCMAFGLVDSVQKNLNIKTWNASTDTLNSTATFYIAFYDMDTCLGRDNDGKDVIYFAFSDYWNSKIEDTNIPGYKDTKTINALHVYTDFYPYRDKGDYSSNIPIGYDLPSSYLFAIAKYARYFKFINPSIGEDEQSEIRDIFSYTPETLWTSWRNKRNNGPCQSAKYFIEKYFIRNMDDIPEALFSLNYRFKYLVKTSSGYDTNNYSGFHGRGIYSLYEWLSGRFHILDAYFNVNKSTEYVETLKYDGENPVMNNGEPVWETLKIKENDKSLFISNGVISNNSLYIGYPIVDADSSNKDIYLLKDIFNDENSSSIGQKYNAGVIQFAVKTLKYSPNLIQTPSSITRYLFEDSNQKYFVNQNVNGNEAVAFLGSKMWTWLDSINFAINNGRISINSDYLENINGTQLSCTFSENNFNTPSVRTISLTSEQYTGELVCKVKGDGTDLFQNIDNIDISGSQLDLNIDGEGVTTINASNVNRENGKIWIKNCYNLNSVDITNSSFESCIITPVWSTYSTFYNTSIKSIELSGKTNTNGEDNTILISGDSVCTNITLENFQKIIIRDCPKLTNILIRDIENVKELSIINCNTIADKKTSIYKFEELNINGNNGIIDLSRFINLEKINFSGTFGFTHVNIPSGTKLEAGAFTNTRLKTIDVFKRQTSVNDEPILDNGTDEKDAIADRKYTESTIILTGPGIFKNTKYAMTNSQGTINKMIIPNNVTDINSMFAYSRQPTSDTTHVVGDIDYRVAEGFLHSSNVCVYESIENIIDISDLFRGQKIVYSISRWIEDIQKYNNSLLSLGTFIGATRADNVFRNTGNGGEGGVTCVTAETFRWYTGEIDDNGEYAYTVIGNVNKTQKPISINNIVLTINHITDNVFTDIIDCITCVFNGDASANMSSQNIEVIDHITRMSYIETNKPIVLRKLFEGKRNNTTIYPILIQNIIGFNIKYKTGQGNNVKTTTLDFKNLFKNVDENNIVTNVWPSLKDIVSSFNNTISDFDNINDIGLNTLHNLEKIDNSFTFDNKNQPIRYRNFVNWVNIFSRHTYGLCKTKTCDFYKCLTREELYSLCNEIGTYATETNYLFKKLILIIDDDEDNELKLSSNNLAIFSNVTTAQYMFTEMYMINHEDIDEYGVIKNNSQIIPIRLTSNTLATMPNLKDVSYMFVDTVINGNLPFNFFNKITGTARKQVNCKNNNNETVTAELIYPTYDISNAIINMNHTFANIKIIGNTYFDDLDSLTAQYSLKDNQGNTYDWYYTDSEDDPTPFLNNNLNGHYVKDWDVYINLKDGDQIHYTFKNNNIVGDIENVKTHYILPPDILWCCTSSTNLISCFENSEFEGILPSPLFKNFDLIERGTNMFNNLNVIPNKFTTITLYNQLYPRNAVSTIFNNENIESGYTIENSIYVYIPKYFTKINNISNLFNFNLNCPKEMLITGKTIEYVSYYLMYKKSIPKTIQNMSNAFPSNQNQITYKYKQDTVNSINHTPDFHSYDFGIHYNLMIDDEATLENLNNPHLYYGDDINDETGETTPHEIIKCMNTVIVEGIDATYFDKLIPINLLNDNLSAIYYGYIFTPNTFNASGYSISTTTTSPIITVGNGKTLELSINAILPNSTNNIRQRFMYFAGKSSNHTNSVYKEQIEDYANAFYRDYKSIEDINYLNNKNAYMYYINTWNSSASFNVDMYEYGNTEAKTMKRGDRNNNNI